jgi:hypothetical protein
MQHEFKLHFKTWNVSSGYNYYWFSLTWLYLYVWTQQLFYYDWLPWIVVTCYMITWGSHIFYIFLNSQNKICWITQVFLDLL